MVLPVYNEEENIILQYERIVETVAPLKKSFEIVFVDDGSIDQSFALLSKLAKKDKRVKIVRFRRNFGQTAAMAAGIDYSIGEIIVFMDSDLQNEPADIANLLSKIEEGYDVVSGWRYHRKDKLFSRKIPSRIANKIISKVTGVSLHDLGCSLKAYRSEVLKKVKLYGEMHRFIPIHASWVGAKIIEIPVGHHPRQFGESKYGIKRTFKVMLDLMTVKFLSSFSTKPIYLYGGFGLVMFFLSFSCTILTVLMKYFRGYNMTGNPFLLLSVMFFILGVVMILMGIQSEILIRIYHEAQNVRPYHVKTVVNIKDESKKR
ncbi:MAG TPA: glycosyltransferase family 2 protein [Spirochaetota bacterium]